MSETLLPSPYDFDSPEGRAEREAQLRGVMFTPNLIRGALAQILPYRTDEQGNTTPQIPLQSAAEALYGGVGTLGPIGINAVLGTHLGPAPGATGALKDYEDTKRAAGNLIPAATPQNESEKALEDVLQATGGAAIPGGPLTKLPMLARGAVSTVLPTFGKGGGPLVSAAVTGGIDTYMEDRLNKAYADIGVDPAAMHRGDDLTQPDTDTTVQHTQPGGAATVPFDIASNQRQGTMTDVPTPLRGQLPTPPVPPQNPPGIADLGAFNRPDIKVSAPIFGSTGETETSWGTRLAEAAGGAALLWTGLKYGGKVFDPTIKFLTGNADQLDTAANAAAHNANLTALDTGMAHAAPGAPFVSAAARGEAPLPGKAGTVGTNLAQQGWDETRVLTELGKATAPTRTISDRIAADIGSTLGGSSLPNRVAEQMATGVNDATGTVMPKLKETLQRYANLTEDQQRILDQGLNASDELNSRKMKFDQAVASGGSLADVDLRHNFRDTESSLLRADRNAMLNDPQTKAIADTLYAIDKANLNEGVLMGRITSQDASRILRQRPNHIPSTDENGITTGVLRERDLTVPGYQTPNARAIDAIVQNYYKLYQEYAINKTHNQLTKQIIDWQNANPNRARILTEVPVGTEGPRTITVYDAGTPKTYSVENTNVWHAFQGGTTRTDMLWGMSDALRRSLQQGTTGVSATLLAGRPFSAIGLLRNAQQLGVDRQAGTSFGAIDRALQGVTGGRVGLRGDPTGIGGSIDFAVRNSGATLARGMSDMLRNPENVLSNGLRKLTGDAWADHASQWLADRYTNSWLAKQRSVGAAGAGAGGLADVPIFNVGATNRVMANPMAEQLTSLFQKPGIPTPFGTIPIPGSVSKGLTYTYLDVRSLMRELNQTIQEGANTYYFRHLDPNLSSNEQSLLTRRALGDPSEHGASTSMQYLGRSIPYFNPSLQDAVRMARNFRDNPVAFTLGTMQTLSTAALASIFTAMLGGARHVNMLEQLIGTHDRASNVTIFHDPSNEHNYTQFSLPQRWRMIYPVLLELYATGMGAFQAREGEPMYDRIVHSLTDMFQSHVSMSTQNAAIRGLSDFADIVQPPQPIQIAAAAAGKQINPPIKTLLSNAVEGKPLGGGYISDVQGPQQLPGQGSTSSYMSKDDNSWARNLVGTIGGMAGHAYYDAFHNFIDRFNVRHDIADSLTGLVGDAGQSWRDNAPFGTMIWGNNVSMTKRSPLAENVQGSLAKMKQLVQIQDPVYQGFTRSGGAPIMTNGESPVNSDPDIRYAFTTARNNYQRLEQTWLGQIMDKEKQLQQIDNDTALPKDMQRSTHNQIAGEINDLYKHVDEEIKFMNTNMSQFMGKHFDVRSFDPSRGKEQFHE